MRGCDYPRCSNAAAFEIASNGYCKAHAWMLENLRGSEFIATPITERTEAMTTHESPELDVTLSTLAEQHPHAVQAIRNATDPEAAQVAFRTLLRAVYDEGHRVGAARSHHAPTHEPARKSK